MTPFRGVGGNTALRDAHNLSDAFISHVRDGRPLLEAIGEYEREMRKYGFEKVQESLQACEMAHMEDGFSKYATEASVSLISGFFWLLKTASGDRLNLS